MLNCVATHQYTCVCQGAILTSTVRLSPKRTIRFLITNSSLRTTATDNLSL